LDSSGGTIIEMAYVRPSVVDRGRSELWQIIGAHAPFSHNLYHPIKALIFIHNSNVLLIKYCYQALALYKGWRGLTFA